MVVFIGNSIGLFVIQSRHAGGKFQVPDFPRSVHAAHEKAAVDFTHIRILVNAGKGPIPVPIKLRLPATGTAEKMKGGRHRGKQVFRCDRGWRCDFGYAGIFLEGEVVQMGHGSGFCSVVGIVADFKHTRIGVISLGGRVEAPVFPVGRHHHIKLFVL